MRGRQGDGSVVWLNRTDRTREPSPRLLYNGNQIKAYNAINNAAQTVINSKGILKATFNSVENPLIVNINGFTINIGGTVIDGIFKLGTAFIK